MSLKSARDLLEQGQITEAISAYTQIAGNHPDDFQTQLGLGVALTLGKRYTEAKMLLEHALSLSPNHPDARFALAHLAEAQNDFVGAAQQYRAILHSYPDHITSAHNLGALSYRLGDFEAAAQQHAENVQRHPDHIPSWRDLGQSMVASGRVQNGFNILQDAQRRFPNDRETQFALGLAALRLGDWKTGWDAYEARWLPGEWENRIPSSCPTWDGAPLDKNQRLVVFGEQGLGDNLMFSRYLTLLPSLAANIVYVVHPALVTLFQASFPLIQVSAQIKTRDDDVCTSIASLPLKLIAQCPAPPKQIPYLTPSPADCLPELLDIVASLPKPFMGIVWRGGQSEAALASRSLRLSDVLPAIPMPFQNSGTLVSLQKDLTPAEVKQLAELGIIDLSPALSDFNATAYILNAAEGLLSVDTAVAHLAGALGKPVILLQRPEGDWRWGGDFSGKHWYSNIAPIVIERH